MPLTEKGKKLKKIFEKEYGKKKGERIFYAYEKKHKGIRMPSTKKILKTGVSLGALGIGLGILNKSLGGN